VLDLEAEEGRMMTDLLRRAFDKAAALPEHEQQALAELILGAIESEDERWEAALNRSPGKLQRLLEEAREDARAGRTEPLDPDKL
jgi:hypothetical protein